MVRAREQLEASRDELRAIVRRLEKEIKLVEADIEALGVSVRLDDDFFWTVVAPMLVDAPKGLTSAYMLKMLQTGGFDIQPGNFRTFISRCGRRDLLESLGSGRALQWRLTDQAVQSPLLRRR